MKTSKKVICLLLTLIMVVSSLPMVAFEAEAATIKYEFKYSKHGGTGTMERETRTYGQQKALAKNDFTRTNYKFDGWCAYSNKKGAWLYEKNGEYQWQKEQKKGWILKKFKNKDNDRFLAKPTTINDDVITFQAQWKANIVAIAEGEIGTSGRPNKYTRWYGYTGEWCGMFVSWCAYKAGVLNNKVPKSALCSYSISCFKVKGKFKGNNSSYIPVSGDIIFFDSNKSKDGDYEHVGIVVSYDRGSKKITTIEGNSGDKVVRKTYTRDEFMAFAHPDY